MDESNTEEARWQLANRIYEDMIGYRALTAQKRQSLRSQYARLRELGSIMVTKGWVTWQDKGRGYTAAFLSDRNYYEQETIKALFKLQENISQQAMLLLEMDHACDLEEAKRNNQLRKDTTNDDTDKTGRS